MRENAADSPVVERHNPVFNQSAKPILDANHFDAVMHRGLGDSADGSVETGAIAASSQNPNGSGFGSETHRAVSFVAGVARVGRCGSNAR